MKSISTRIAACNRSGFLIVFALSQTAHADGTSFRNGGASLHETPLPTQRSADSGDAWQHELRGQCHVIAAGPEFSRN